MKTWVAILFAICLANYPALENYWNDPETYNGEIYQL